MGLGRKGVYTILNSSTTYCPQEKSNQVKYKEKKEKIVLHNEILANIEHIRLKEERSMKIIYPKK